MSGILDKAAHKIRSTKKGDLKPKTHHFFYLLVWVMGMLAPPVAVLIRFGLGRDFFINVLCTICGYFPGHFHNFYCQTIRNNRNAARTPRWAVKYGLVKVEDKRGGKHMWAGRYDERLPDSARRGYGEDGSRDSLGDGGASEWDGRGPEPASRRRIDGSDDGPRHSFSPWNRTVSPSEVEGGPPPPPENEGAFDPIDNEQFYPTGAQDSNLGSSSRHRSGSFRGSSSGTGTGGGGKKKKGLKGILSHRDRYETNAGEGDRFDRMKAARGGGDDDYYGSPSTPTGEEEYQDEFERELNEGAAKKKALTPQATGSARPAPARFDSFEAEGPEDAWGGSSVTAAPIVAQRTAERLRPTRTGSSGSGFGDAPGRLVPTKTGGTVKGSKEDDALFNHTF